MKVKSFQEFWIKILSTSVLDQWHQRILSEWPEWICLKPWWLVYWVWAMFSDISSHGGRTRESRQGLLVNSFYRWARKEASCGSFGPTSWPGGRESWTQSQIKTTKRWRKRYLDTKRFGRPLAHWTAEHHPVWEVNILWTFKISFNSRKRKEMVLLPNCLL